MEDLTYDELIARLWRQSRYFNASPNFSLDDQLLSVEVKDFYGNTECWKEQPDGRYRLVSFEVGGIEPPDY